MLTGSEIDNVIADVLARMALAAERARRKRWAGVIENAPVLLPTRNRRGPELG